MQAVRRRVPWKIARIAIALLPWIASMYVFYWLDASGNWTSETPHRGKLSVLLLSSGMALSFLTYTKFPGAGNRG